VSTPRWGHKPRPVADKYAYWGAPPPAPSERAVYWVRRWREGSWKPNGRLLQECVDCRAGMLGIWLWEARFVLHPIDMVTDGSRTAAEQVAESVRWSDEPPGPYWSLLEAATGPAAGAVSVVVADLAEAMRQAVREPLTARDMLMGRRR